MLEGTTAEVPDTTGGAPAGEASPSAEVATSDASGSAGAPPSGSGASGASTESDFSTPDTFDWDGWDGETFDSFDEPIRPWAQRFHEFHRSRFDKLLEDERGELAQLKSVYEQLLDGNADPRLEEMTQKEIEYQSRISELEEANQKYQADIQAIEQALEQMADEEARRMADRFKADNPEIFADPEKQKLLGELLDEDWDLDLIPKVISLSPEIREEVREAKRAGTPDQYALKLGEFRKPKPAQPRPAAELVSGATGPSAAPNIAHRGRGDAKTLDDHRAWAIRMAMQRAG